MRKYKTTSKFKFHYDSLGLFTFYIYINICGEEGEKEKLNWFCHQVQIISLKVM